MSWLLLLALTFLAAIGALSLATRHASHGRAEAFVVALLAFFALVGVPVEILGYSGALTRAPLALLSLVFSAVALWAGKRDRKLPGHLGAIRSLGASLLRLPFEAIRGAFVERSWVTLLLVVCLFAILGSTLVAYLAPSESWDGLFYHEPIVGFAIQNHAFGMVTLPNQMVLQGINGYPRFCESVAIWFVIFTDKSLIEIGNSLAAPGLVAAMYVLLRRHARRTASLGWASSLLLMPAMLTQLRTTMIDVQTTFFLLAATHFVTRWRLRSGDALAAIAAVSLAASSKSTGLVWGPPLLVVLAVRLWRARRELGARTGLGLALGGWAIFGGVETLTLVRNWRAFRDPLWPVSLQLPRLGIDWRGLATLAEMTPTPPWREVLATKFGPPSEGLGDVLARDYGYAVPWVVLPLLVVALATELRRRWRQPTDRSEDSSSFTLLVGLGIAFILVTPSYSIARYNAHVVGIALVVVARLLAADRLKALESGALAATLWLSVIPWFWNGWLFGVDLTARDLGRMLVASHRARGSMNVTHFGMPARTAVMRDAELGPGDIVVFTQEMWFPGVLWNSDLSNRVVHQPFGSDEPWLAKIEERRAKWIVVGARSAARHALETHPERYSLVGVAAAEDRTVAFRRLP